MSIIEELPFTPDIDQECDQLLNGIAIVGAIQLSEAIKDPSKGHFVDSRGEEWINVLESPQSEMAVLGERVCEWINRNFTLLSSDRISDDGIISRREYTDEEMKGRAILGMKIGPEPSDGDLVIAWKNGPTFDDVPLPKSQTSEEEQRYNDLAANPDRLSRYLVYKKYIPKDEVRKIPKRLMQLIEEIRQDRLKSSDVLYQQNSGSALHKPEDYGTYYVGDLGREIVRLVVINHLQKPNALTT